MKRLSFIYFSHASYLQIRHRINLLDYASRSSNGDGKVGNRLGHDAARTNRATFANGNTWHDSRVAPNPAIITNDDRLGVLDAVAARLHPGLVGS